MLILEWDLILIFFLKDTKNEKVLFKTVSGQLKRFSSKMIKIDENNQYGMAMTRPLPYG